MPVNWFLFSAEKQDSESPPQNHRKDDESGKQSPERQTFSSIHLSRIGGMFWKGLHFI